MKSSFSFIKDSVLLRMTIAVVAGVFLVVGTAGASTTISTNILTGGTLGALGVSTFGATASTTISAAGLLATPNASTTALSCLNNCTFGSSATSSFTAAGVLTLQNGETISNATDGTIAVTATNVTFSGLASSTTFIVGAGSASTISGLAFGYCTFASVSVNATSSNMASCTGATGVTSGDRIFVQATSSLPDNFVIEAASSTADGVIQVRLFNMATTTADSGADDTGINSLNFWAVR